MTIQKQIQMNREAGRFFVFGVAPRRCSKSVPPGEDYRGSGRAGM
jgi:hypothetical protein